MRLQRRSPFRVLLLAACLLVPLPSSAATIISNLAGTDDLNFGGIGIRAQRFTTDDHVYLLENVVIRVAEFVRPALGVSVQIWSHDRALRLPDSPLADFAIPLLPDVFADTVFTPTIPVTLSALTDYWITTTHSSSHAGAFQFMATASAATGPGVMGSRLRTSDDGGLTWGLASSLNMKLAVNGSMVPPHGTPEPATLTALLLGLAALGLVRRRR